MSEKIRFTVSRDAWIEYEADKPEGFDNMSQEDQWVALLELADAAKEISGDTHRLDIYVSESNNPL